MTAPRTDAGKRKSLSSITAIAQCPSECFIKPWCECSFSCPTPVTAAWPGPWSTGKRGASGMQSTTKTLHLCRNACVQGYSVPDVSQACLGGPTCTLWRSARTVRAVYRKLLHPPNMLFDDYIFMPARRLGTWAQIVA